MSERAKNDNYKTTTKNKVEIVVVIVLVMFVELLWWMLQWAMSHSSWVRIHSKKYIHAAKTKKRVYKCCIRVAYFNPLHRNISFSLRVVNKINFIEILAFNWNHKSFFMTFERCIQNCFFFRHTNFYILRNFNSFNYLLIF